MTDSMLCNIRVKGHLTGQWSGWFGGLAVQNLPDEQALLTGQVPDQAALFGVLARIRDLGMRVIALNCIEKGAESLDLEIDSTAVINHGWAEKPPSGAEKMGF